MKKMVGLGIIALLAIPTINFAQEVDASMMQKIREEGLQHSKVMDIAFNLTDKNGSRLANSEGYMRAANYAKETLSGWGVENARLEAWGEFGKGWDLEKMYLAITAPYYKPLLAWPKTWTAGTKGLKKAGVIVVDVKDSATVASYKGQLKGKLIIIDQATPYKQSFKADAVRYTDDELEKMAAATMQPSRPIDTAQQRRMREQMSRSGGARAMAILKEMAKEEGAVGMLTSAPRNHDGTIFSQGG